MVARQVRFQLVAAQHGYRHTGKEFWVKAFSSAKVRAAKAEHAEEVLFARIRADEAATEGHLHGRGMR